MARRAHQSVSGAAETVRGRLFALRDETNAAFMARLVPTLPPESVLGVRMPDCRALAKELCRMPDIGEFLTDLPHRYMDENNLHALILNEEKDCAAAVAAIDAFLPYVDNWATCDVLRPKAFKKHPSALPDECRRWMRSGATYTVRFGIEMLMTHYLDENFRPEYLEEVSIIKSKEYYVNMMIAWYFATALAKQYEAAISYIEQRRLNQWTHNKTIRKTIESCRITEERKAYLRTLTIRE
ncbi:MAG: DNA alkylation repair protein [Oscillospiraceae bacterium]